jgi:peptide-methionine (S)-S-oxide reductase
VIYCEDEIDLNHAKESLKQYQEIITNAKYGEITTEIKKYNDYFFAEEYHQQYLAKNPNGYCGIGGTGCEFK